MPAAPWACTATLSPSRWASSTSADISASEYCWPPTESVFEKTPPVPQTLITSAPYLRNVRTVARIASGPSATAGFGTLIEGGNSVESQCPPVAPIAYVAGTIRGPGT